MHLKKFFVRYYYSFHTILTFGAIKFICFLSPIFLYIVILL